MIKVQELPTFEDFKNKLNNAFKKIKEAEAQDFFNAIEELEDKQISLMFKDIIEVCYNNSIDIGGFANSPIYSFIKEDYINSSLDEQRDMKEEFIKELELRINKSILNYCPLQIRVFTKETLTKIIKLNTELCNINNDFTYTVPLSKRQTIGNYGKNSYNLYFGKKAYFSFLRYICEANEDNPYMYITVSVTHLLSVNIKIPFLKINYEIDIKGYSEKPIANALYLALEEINKSQNYIEFVFNKDKSEDNVVYYY